MHADDGGRQGRRVIVVQPLHGVLHDRLRFRARPLVQSMDDDRHGQQQQAKKEQIIVEPDTAAHHLFLLKF